MRAAILTEQNAPLLVADVEMPDLDVGQVRVKVDYSGICGKQIDEISGRRGEDPYLPHLLGHEGSGVVEEVGPGVRKVRAGDRVVLHWMKGSGIDAAPPRFSLGGKVISAGCVTTFSEYTIASENRLTPIPPDSKADAAALLGCAVTTGLGIVFNNGRMKPGESIVVFGVGGVGLNVLQGAALVNAFPIVAVDVQDHKLALARRLGATHTVNSRSSQCGAELRDLTSGRGFDVAVDTIGHQEIREIAYDHTAAAGRTIFAGVPDHRERITIDSFPVHFGRRIIGVHGGDTNPDEDIPRYLALYERGKLRLDEQITHRFLLNEINDAIEVVRKGDVGRCLVSSWHSP